MRRKYKGRKIQNVWRGYSDMMAGLLLLFILVMSIALVSFQRSYEAEAKVREEFESQAVVMENQTAVLNSKVAELESQKTIMDEQQRKIDEIIGVKAEIIAAIKEEFQEKHLNVGIDEDTGAIIFDANVLFAFNESALTDEGKVMLDEMLPIYCNTLLQEEYLPYISQIIIEGFTDSNASFGFNLDLSQKRSLAVAQYLLSIEHGFLSEKEAAILESRISASGRSKNGLKYTDSGAEDAAASRRVEVKFRLTDEEMIKELQSIINN